MRSNSREEAIESFFEETTELNCCEDTTLSAPSCLASQSQQPENGEETSLHRETEKRENPAGVVGMGLSLSTTTHLSPEALLSLRHGMELSPDSANTWELSRGRLRRFGLSVRELVACIPSHVSTLNVESCDLSHREIDVLLEGLALHEHVTDLNLSYNSIHVESIHLLTQLLSSTRSLQHLRLSSTHMHDEGVILLASCFSGQHRNQSLMTLDLWGNHISDVSATVLANNLVSHPSIQVLNLGNNALGESCGEVFGQLLAQNSNLHTIDLGRNFLGDVGTACLAEILRSSQNRTLTSLNLFCNRIEYEGAYAISRYLKWKYCPLIHLRLTYNTITDHGAEKIASALRMNQRLQEFDLGVNLLSERSCASIATALSSNSTLREIDLSWNYMCRSGTLALSTSIKHHPSLKKLILSNCGIDDEAACSLARRLLKNKTVEYVDLCRNEITDRGALALTECLARMSHMRTISLVANNLSPEVRLTISEWNRIRRLSAPVFTLSKSSPGTDDAVEEGTKSSPLSCEVQNASICQVPMTTFSDFAGSNPSILNSDDVVHAILPQPLDIQSDADGSMEDTGTQDSVVLDDDPAVEWKDVSSSLNSNDNPISPNFVSGKFFAENDDEL